jgi:hypothetical protein
MHRDTVSALALAEDLADPDVHVNESSNQDEYLMVSAKSRWKI